MAQAAPDALGGAIPSNDPYETSFTTGQRNIFAKPGSGARTFRSDNVTRISIYNGFPTVGTPALPTACGGSNTGFYSCPYGLGNVNKTIGRARQIQFSLHLVF
jgi:hypothetical protein